jgi:hypothetical protein
MAGLPEPKLIVLDRELISLLLPSSTLQHHPPPVRLASPIRQLTMAPTNKPKTSSKKIGKKTSSRVRGKKALAGDGPKADVDEDTTETLKDADDGSKGQSFPILELKSG